MNEITAIHEPGTVENLIILLLFPSFIYYWKRFEVFILVDVQNTLSNILVETSAVKEE